MSGLLEQSGLNKTVVFKMVVVFILVNCQLQGRQLMAEVLKTLGFY